jgi:outer membrane protein
LGDASKSPIIREFGSRNQLSGGFGLSYTFTIKR